MYSDNRDTSELVTGLQARGHRLKVIGYNLVIGDNWSVSYMALITWLCSLIPNDIEDVAAGRSDPPPPFYVIGLQQMLFDGALILAVTVVPSSDTKPSASRRGVKVS